MMIFKKILLLQLFGLMSICISSANGVVESAYLHTDRNVYITGETIYFKFYLINSETLKLSELSKVGYIVLRSEKSESVIKLRVNLNKGTGMGSFELPDTLYSGIYQITAFTRFMRNRGEQSFFRKNITVINRHDKLFEFKSLGFYKSNVPDTDYDNSSIKIKIDKETYNKRQKVMVSFSNLSANANVSVSVAENSPVPIPYISLDKTLKALKSDKNEFSSKRYFSPEFKGKTLSGVVTDIQTDSVVGNAVVLLSCIDSVANLQYAVTNPQGIFQFLLSDYYTDRELFVTILKNSETPNCKIKVFDDFKIESPANLNLSSLNWQFDEYFFKTQNMVFINKTYNTDARIKIQESKNIEHLSPKFHHTKVKTIIPAEYEPLNDFLEIAVELLPHVKIFKDKTGYNALVYNSFLNRYYMRPPAIFLDGVFVDNIEKIIGLGTDKINKIEIIDEERAFGDLIFGGLVSIFSKTYAMEKSKTESPSLRIFNESDHKGFVSTALNSGFITSKHIPLFKPLLYWNADLNLYKNKEKEISFYTSDLTGSYTIRVEGISENGSTISSSKIFSVEK